VRRVFVSHGKADTWLAQQLAKEIRERGARTFLDESDIPKGADYKSIIRNEVVACDELVAIFTPWSASRFWVWSEVGAAWGQGKFVVAILYGLTLKDLEELGQSKAVFEDINILSLNDADRYLAELEQRSRGLRDV
jgi:TIR domain